MKYENYEDNEGTLIYRTLYIVALLGTVYSLMPGVFIRIPSKGSLQAVALIHTTAILIVLTYILDPVFLFLYRILMAIGIEGFTRMSPPPRPPPPPPPPPKPAPNPVKKLGGGACQKNADCYSNRCSMWGICQ